MSDTMSFKYDLFLSYSSRDGEWVQKLARDLEEKYKLKCFLDKWDIRPGDNIKIALRNGIRESQRISFVISPDSIKSDWAQLEQCIATIDDPSNRSRRLIPLYRRTCELPGSQIPEEFRILSYIDFRDDAQYQNQLDRLAKEVKGYPPQRWVAEGTDHTKTHPIKTMKVVDKRYSINSYCSCLIDDLGLWRGLGTFSNKNLKQIYVSHMLIDKSQKGRELSDPLVLESLLDRPENSLGILVEGNAGSGKTMLLRNWSVTLAMSRLQSNTEGYIPIYLPLGWLERVCGKGQWNKSLVEITAQRYPDVIGRDTEVLLMALSEAVQGNRVVILIDAVDEISKPALPHFLDWLKRIRACGVHCPMVLTSRPRTHTDGVNVDNKMYVRAFSTQQRETFIENWFGEHGQANVAALRTHLQQSFRLQAPEVAGNPLFLTMMCVEFEKSGKLSATQGKLLDQFVRLLLEAWDAQQGVQRTNILLDLKLRVLESIAGYLFDLNRTNIGERELFDHTRNLLNQISSPIQASDVIEEIVNTGGLLVKDRGDDYKFCHDLFLEYFMARHKAFGLSDSEQKRWLKEHIFDPRYEKVIQFYQELKFNG